MESERERGKGFVEGKEEGREGQSGYLINRIVLGGGRRRRDVGSLGGLG